MPRTGGALKFLAACLACVALTACGESEDARLVTPADLGDSPQHIHGLAVNPADGSLFIATHTGLWRAGSDSDRARRVGESHQDVMGFTVAGPDRFLGSGHPDPRQDLPPLLGLIESGDEGESWKSVSLLGKADFHVLRYRGQRIYGFDATNERLLASDDDGRSWRRLAVPAPLLDLAIDPRDIDVLVASTEHGLQRSADGGGTWRPLTDLTGVLAWAARDALYLVDGAGIVHRSRDGGRSFDAVGAVGGQPAAFNHDGDDLLLALADATVKRSTDGGRNWTVRARP